MLTADQLQADLLTIEELGPEWEDYKADWKVEDPQVPGSIRCGRRLLYQLVDGVVIVFLEVATPAPTPSAEMVHIDMRRGPRPSRASRHRRQVGDVMATVELEPPFTPSAFGNDAVAVRGSGTTIDGLPAATLVVVWNVGEVQAKVGTVSYSPLPLSARQYFDGLWLAERQRDKLRIALSL